MSKNLIIGAFTNYEYNQLKPWVESIDEVGIKCDKVMIVFDTTMDTLEKLNARGWELIKVQQQGKLPIHVERFVYIYNYLNENDKWLEYDYILTTDVKDVYFQTDPFVYMEGAFVDTDNKIIVASEGLYYKDEPWGADNLKNAFGDYFFNVFKDNEIYNVGVWGGEAQYVKDMALSIFLMSLNRPIPIVDQATFNVILATQPWQDITSFCNADEGFACHAGTLADPSKMEFFRSFLVAGEPTYKDNIVCDEHGEPFCIVHQYDRVPEWKEYISKKYKQEESAELFVYRT